jgi:hypothetical protein
MFEIDLKEFYHVESKTDEKQPTTMTVDDGDEAAQLTLIQQSLSNKIDLDHVFNHCAILVIEQLPSILSDLLPKDEQEEPPVFKSFDLASAAEYMAKCSNILVISGAGISTSAGIPDFRSPGTGLYSQLEKYNLPSPETIFQLDYFRVHKCE